MMETLSEKLSNDTITFGKYKNKTLSDVLKDREYCRWLTQQEWFANNYSYLFNRVNTYEPLTYFIKPYALETLMVEKSLRLNRQRLFPCSPGVFSGLTSDKSKGKSQSIFYSGKLQGTGSKGIFLLQ